jgi:hypothetical protein
MWRAGNTLGVWNTNSNWNFTSYQEIGNINSAAAIAQEPLFSQDFNGDGLMGITPI